MRQKEKIKVEIYQKGSHTGDVWVGNKHFATVYTKKSGEKYVILKGKKVPLNGCRVYI